MTDEFELFELEKDGKKLKFKVGVFEPKIGDYLLSEKGDIHRVESAGHRFTEEGKVCYIETSAEPGILMKVYPKMKFAKLIK